LITTWSRLLPLAAVEGVIGAGNELVDAFTVSQLGFDEVAGSVAEAPEDQGRNQVDGENDPPGCLRTKPLREERLTG